MPACGLAAALEHVEEAGQIGVGIGMGIGQGMPHAGLCREMHDMRKPVHREQRRHGAAIGNVDLLEAEAWKSPQHGEAGVLEARIVVGVEIVEADHVMSVLQQAARDMHADEPGRAGDENRRWRSR